MRSIDLLKSLCICVFLVLLVGCNASQDTSKQSKQPDAEVTSKLRPVRLLLNWYPEAEHGGFYAAKELGLFEAEGLDVTIVPGGKTTVIAQELTLGRVEFGVANADDVLVAAQQDAPIVAVMTPMQHTPRCIMVREETGIKTFEDLKDVTLLLDSSRAFVPYLKSLGYLQDVTIAPYFGSIAPLVANERFGCQGYSFSEPFLAQQEGMKVKSLMVSEIGYDPYCSLLVTSSKVIDQQPEVVRKVVQASAKGWQAYLESPDKTNEVILKANTQGMTMEALQFGAVAIKPLSQPEDEQQFGSMSSSRWSTLIEQLEKVDFIDKGKLKAESVFTNNFID